MLRGSLAPWPGLTGHPSGASERSRDIAWITRLKRVTTGVGEVREDGGGRVSRPHDAQSARRRA